MNLTLVIKVATGIFVVPIALAANALWPWWEKQSLPVKVLSGVLVMPIVAFSYATSFWWNSFEV